MYYDHACIFVDGHFRQGSFSVENGRFTHVLDSAPHEDGVDLNGAYVIPGLVVSPSGTAVFSGRMEMWSKRLVRMK